MPKRSVKRVEAGGGVIVREGGEGVEVAVVHRPRYDDWSLPKGKLEEGESFEQGALREVEEETGLICDLGEELSPTRYRDRKGRPKIVRYWRMTVSAGSFKPNDEVDELLWLAPREAIAKLDFEHDAKLVREACAPPTG
jgi:8-oxo-dGTP diphosphatase